MLQTLLLWPILFCVRTVPMSDPAPIEIARSLLSSRDHKSYTTVDVGSSLEGTVWAGQARGAAIGVIAALVVLGVLRQSYVQQCTGLHTELHVRPTSWVNPHSFVDIGLCRRKAPNLPAQGKPIIAEHLVAQAKPEDTATQSNSREWLFPHAQSKRAQAQFLLQQAKAARDQAQAQQRKLQAQADELQAKEGGVNSALDVAWQKASEDKAAAAQAQQLAAEVQQKVTAAATHLKSATDALAVAGRTKAAAAAAATQAVKAANEAADATAASRAATQDIANAEPHRALEAVQAIEARVISAEAAVDLAEREKTAINAGKPSTEAKAHAAEAAAADTPVLAVQAPQAALERAEAALQAASEAEIQAIQDTEKLLVALLGDDAKDLDLLKAEQAVQLMQELMDAAGQKAFPDKAAAAQAQQLAAEVQQKVTAAATHLKSANDALAVAGRTKAAATQNLSTEAKAHAAEAAAVAEGKSDTPVLAVQAPQAALERAEAALQAASEAEAQAIQDTEKLLVALLGDDAKDLDLLKAEKAVQLMDQQVEKARKAAGSPTEAYNTGAGVRGELSRLRATWVELDAAKRAAEQKQHLVKRLQAAMWKKQQTQQALEEAKGGFAAQETEAKTALVNHHKALLLKADKVQAKAKGVVASTAAAAAAADKAYAVAAENVAKAEAAKSEAEVQSATATDTASKAQASAAQSEKAAAQTQAKADEEQRVRAVAAARALEAANVVVQAQEAVVTAAAALEVIDLEAESRDRQAASSSEARGNVMDWNRYRASVRGQGMSRQQISEGWAEYKQAHGITSAELGLGLAKADAPRGNGAAGEGITWNQYQASVGGQGWSKKRISNGWAKHKIFAGCLFFFSTCAVIVGTVLRCRNRGARPMPQL